VQAKMAQQGKQMRVGARKGFTYRLLKLVLPANSNKFGIDFKTFFLRGKALYPIKILPCPKFYLFDAHSYL
jgi:hypothetical protein